MFLLCWLGRETPHKLVWLLAIAACIVIATSRPQAEKEESSHSKGNVRSLSWQFRANKVEHEGNILPQLRAVCSGDYTTAECEELKEVHSYIYKTCRAAVAAIEEGSHCYSKWFGGKQEAYGNRHFVISVFNDIAKSVKENVYTYIFRSPVCEVYPKWYAYTEFNVPSIHLCEPFMKQAAVPPHKNTKLCTIIHEICHIVNMRVRDLGPYEAEFCRGLSKYPSIAVLNADNYCWLVECVLQDVVLS